MKSLNACPGCLKNSFPTYCNPCRRKLFGGQNVNHILTFTRPEYNQRKTRASGERISISGVQTKHSLKLEKRQLILVEHGGEYILKPIPNGPYENLDEVPANEHLTMQIAAQVFDIRTAENALVFFPDGKPAYITRRFDVMPDGRKISQEDFAQLGEKSEEKDGKNYKYDLSYEEIAELLRKYVKAYPVQVEEFFYLVLFNYFVQNGDAHLKNFSLTRSEEYGDSLLTPAYDLMNTRIHVPNETDMALPLFKGGFNTESFNINGKHCQDDFTEFAKRIGMKEERIMLFIERFGDYVIEKIQDLVDRSFLSNPLKETYVNLVKERLKRFAYSYNADIYGRNEIKPRQS